MKTQDEGIATVSVSTSSSDGRAVVEKKTVSRRLKAIVWDTLERSPEERRFLAKLDFFILTWAGLTYFSKNLNTNNVCKFDLKEPECHIAFTYFYADHIR